MTWCNSVAMTDNRSPTATSATSSIGKKSQANLTPCPGCSHRFWLCEEVAAGTSTVQDELPDLPAGVKFDPSDQEILEHLRRKARPDAEELLHPLIDHFIPTIHSHDGICYTHPENLPGVRKDGLVRHFFHRPSKAYTTGTRKRRKVLGTDVEEGGGETRWHKTGKTRSVFAGGSLKGHKKILVLYANCGRQRKPEKTNWVMHQYHLGSDEDEKDGELVVSKVFYQTQPRNCGGVSAAAAKADEVEKAVQGGAVKFAGVGTDPCNRSSSSRPYNNLLHGHDGGATDGRPSFAAIFALRATRTSILPRVG